MSCETAAKLVFRLHDISVSGETIRRYENDAYTEETADPALVAALPEIYRVKLTKLSPVVAQRARRLSEMLGRVCQ